MIQPIIATQLRETKQVLHGNGREGQALHESAYLRRSSRSSPSRVTANRKELSKREREVVQLLADGNCNKEIASSLNISVRTVEVYRARLMLKLEVHSLAHVIRYAVQNKLVVF
jgi:DNA-binding NarL/FixJ family response regulator